MHIEKLKGENIPEIPVLLSEFSNDFSGMLDGGRTCLLHHNFPLVLMMMMVPALQCPVQAPWKTRDSLPAWTKTTHV